MDLPVAAWMTCSKEWRLNGWTFYPGDPVQVTSVDWRAGLVYLAQSPVPTTLEVLHEHAAAAWRV